MRIWLCLWLFVFCGPLWSEPRDVALVDEVMNKVRENFFDPKFQGANLEALQQRAREEIASTTSWDEKSAVLNRMLAGLKTSHTTYYSPESKGYFEIQGVFSAFGGGKPKEPSYDGIGMETLTTPEGRFISACWAGHPAHKAGLQVGDRILSVDGKPFQEVLSFRGKSQVTIRVQPTSQASSARDIRVPVVSIEAAEAFEKTLRDSAEVVPVGDKSVAYVHVWSYAGQRYQDALQELLCEGVLKDCDAAVIDLRDGWGGAQAGYLNLFNTRIPRMQMFNRQRQPFPVESQWRRPAALLVNERTRSGKEIVSYGFRAYGMGPVVGTPTPGACVGGRPYRLEHGGILYLAVADVLVDGKRLEGVGVQPDLKVDRLIPYCQGADPQKEAALKAAAQTLHRPDNQPKQP
ncbi:PDZ domain-containing protein [bacterium]|nr:PDZ domain-containing protein [bacterium]